MGSCASAISALRGVRARAARASSGHSRSSAMPGKRSSRGIGGPRIDHPHPISGRERQRRQRLGDMHGADRSRFPRARYRPSETSCGLPPRRAGWHRAPAPSAAAWPSGEVSAAGSISLSSPLCQIQGAHQGAAVPPRRHQLFQRRAPHVRGSARPGFRFRRRTAGRRDITPSSLTPKVRRAMLAVAERRLRCLDHGALDTAGRDRAGERRRHRAPRYGCRPGAAPSPRSAPPWPAPRHGRAASHRRRRFQHIGFGGGKGHGQSGRNPRRLAAHIFPALLAASAGRCISPYAAT